MGGNINAIAFDAIAPIKLKTYWISSTVIEMITIIINNIIAHKLNDNLLLF